MNHLKSIVVVAATAFAALALLGVTAASATQLYKYTTPSPNDKLGVGTELQMTLQAGTSLHLVDTFSSPYTVSTCTGSEMKGTVQEGGGEGIHPWGTLSTMSFTGCTDPFTIISNGAFQIQHIPGTTNAELIVSGFKFSFKHTWLGFVCTMEMNGSFGRLTGATSATGYATLDAFADMKGTNCGLPARFTGTFIVTQPTGLIIEAS